MTVDRDCLQMSVHILMYMIFDGMSLQMTICEGATKTVVFSGK